MKVLTSLLQVLSFLVIVESSSVPNCSTVKLTTNSDDVLSSGFNGFGSVGEGWDGSPQTNVTHSCESSPRTGWGRPAHHIATPCGRGT